MITVTANNYLEYIINALKIFFLAFVIGRSVDHLFKLLTNKYKNVNKKMLGIVQLLLVINIAYVMHIFTSEEFSEEFQISHPGILFSSFMINLQTTMFRNLGIV